MSLVIITKYHGPTDRKGSRITATCETGQRAVVNYDHALGSTDNHRAAAVALAHKLWDTTDGRIRCLIGGTIKGGATIKSGTMAWTRDHLAESVLRWAAEPREHGGNPYCLDMVKVAESRLI